jgi:predicted RNase H-like HicB family nuclease
MNAYLILGLLLLVSMAWLVLHPFLEPNGSGLPPIVLPPAEESRSKPTVATRSASVSRATTDDDVAESAVNEPPVAAHSKTPDELRAEIEAAIAARKAAMMRHSCSGCGAAVDTGDAFCRSCGARVKE